MARWPVASHDSDFEPYLDNRPDSSKELFRRFVEMARSCGPVTFELQRTLVVLRGTRRIFGAVRMTDRGLEGYLNLPERLTDPRVRKVDPLTRRLFMNRFVITAGAELDETFGRWLGAARAAGDGAHEAAS